MRKTICLILTVLAAAGCGPKGKNAGLLPQEPDYSKENMWYRTEGMIMDKDVDVFYVTPTCVWSWQDPTGNTIYYMDTENPGQRAATDISTRLGYELFRKSCNFFSPYYRQITMECWFGSEEEIERKYAVAHNDILKAFRYYMDNLNGGRPFFLAGHSQGAKAIIRLIEESLTEEQYSRLIAGYAFGFGISREELEKYPHLKPAEGSVDCGVTVCYNSVSSPEAISPAFKDNAVCINPVNWMTDGTYAPASLNKGSVFFHSDGHSDTLFNTVGARLLPEMNVVQVDGLDDEDYYIPSIGKIFPKGNYHVQEINLYFLNLQENIAERSEAHSKPEK